MPVPVQKSPLITDFKVTEVKSLNFFDLTGEKSATKGTSAKSYSCEVQVAPDGSKAQIFSLWGATGARQNEDWRYFDSETAAKKEFDKIIKSKLKKGYVEVDVAQRALGSEAAKAIVKPVTYTNVDSNPTLKTSSLDVNVQKLVRKLFGATQDFVATTLKCPLGQLSNAQIDEGRMRLNEAKTVLGTSGPSLDKNASKRILEITNNFYKLIPHNLGQGARGTMNHLLLDDLTKIAKKEEDLDTLLDAKSVGLVMSKDSLIDDQYRSLNTDMEWIDKNDSLFNWVNKIVLETRASNHHHLGNIVVHNVWKLNRQNEKDNFLKSIEKIAKECGKQTLTDKLVPHVKARKDIDGLGELYEKANVSPLFHGTRSQNLLGIVKNSLMIRPSCAQLTGAMYGNGIYYGLSSKSINYTSINSSYWAQGNDKYGYLFLVDVALGNQKIVSHSGSYGKNNITPHHSVWAKGGYSGVINDEFIVYDTNQHYIKYIIEFECVK